MLRVTFLCWLLCMVAQWDSRWCCSSATGDTWHWKKEQKNNKLQEEFSILDSICGSRGTLGALPFCLHRCCLTCCILPMTQDWFCPLVLSFDAPSMTPGVFHHAPVSSRIKKTFWVGNCKLPLMSARGGWIWPWILISNARQNRLQDKRKNGTVGFGPKGSRDSTGQMAKINIKKKNSMHGKAIPSLQNPRVFLSDV